MDVSHVTEVDAPHPTGVDAFSKGITLVMYILHSRCNLPYIHNGILGLLFVIPELVYSPLLLVEFLCLIDNSIFDDRGGVSQT